MGRFGWARWAMVSVALGGCGAAGGQQVATSAMPQEEILPPLEGSGLPPVRAESQAGSRRVGDYLAQRFSGTFRERPFTLVEEVVAQEGDLLVVDFTLEQADEKRVLRVRFDAATERAVAASHVRGVEEIPARLSEYEELLALASYAPDSNEAHLGSRRETCVIGPRELECDVEKFRVRVDDAEATLVVTRSSEIERDVAGEVRAADGTLLYRTEVIDLRQSQPQSGEALLRAPAAAAHRR